MNEGWSQLFKSVVRLLDFLHAHCDIKSTEIDDHEEIPKFLNRRGYEVTQEEA